METDPALIRASLQRRTDRCRPPPPPIAAARLLPPLVAAALQMKPGSRILQRKDYSPQALEVSPADRKSYRLVVLGNGLQALLVHDPEAAAAAAPAAGAGHGALEPGDEDVDSLLSGGR